MMSTRARLALLSMNMGMNLMGAEMANMGKSMEAGSKSVRGFGLSLPAGPVPIRPYADPRTTPHPRHKRRRSRNRPRVSKAKRRAGHHARRAKR